MHTNSSLSNRYQPSTYLLRTLVGWIEPLRNTIRLVSCFGLAHTMYDGIPLIPLTSSTDSSMTIFCCFPSWATINLTSSCEVDEVQGINHLIPSVLQSQADLMFYGGRRGSAILQGQARGLRVYRSFTPWLLRRTLDPFTIQGIPN